jgi:hypothetical protein
MPYNQFLGVAGVDSGQLLICDPCYIDSEWEKEDFLDIRLYKHKTSGETLQYRVDFKNYEEPIAKYDNKTMNQLLETSEWEQQDAFEVENEFSYNACAKNTLSEDGFGQLNYKLGHAGVGVVFSTTIGDGMYPVFGSFNDDGTLLSVTIKITENYDESEEF